MPSKLLTGITVAAALVVIIRSWTRRDGRISFRANYLPVEIALCAMWAAVLIAFLIAPPMNGALEVIAIVLIIAALLNQAFNLVRSRRSPR